MKIGTYKMPGYFHKRQRPMPSKNAYGEPSLLPPSVVVQQRLMTADEPRMGNSRFDRISQRIEETPVLANSGSVEQDKLNLLEQTQRSNETN